MKGNKIKEGKSEGEGNEGLNVDFLPLYLDNIF